MALGQAQDQSVHGLPAQADFADSPDLYPALILQDKVFAVFLAEPVSDIIAATVTCSAFFIRFNKILATSQKKA